MTVSVTIENQEVLNLFNISIFIEVKKNINVLHIIEFLKNIMDVAAFLRKKEKKF